MNPPDTAYRVVTSYWGEARPEPATVLGGDEAADVAVVGGGLAGMSTAYFLKRARPDLEVVLIEQEYLGYGASGRNFGNVPQLSHQEIGYLLGLLGEADTRFVVQHQSRMLDDYEALLAEQAVECGFQRLPVLYVAMKAEHLAGLEEIHQLHRRFGIPSRLLTPSHVADVCNVATSGGLSCERNATVQPFLRARGFGRAVASLGVRVHEGTRIDRCDEDDGGVRLHTLGGTVSATQVVFCTNAYTSLLGIGNGAIRAAYTYVIGTTPLHREQLDEIGWSGDHTMLVDAGPLNEHFYLRVTRDGRFLIGGGGRAPETVGAIADHDDPAFYRRLHIEMIRRFACLEDAEVDVAWGGPLGMTESRLPVMSRISPRCFLNAGFNGRGALIAALSGRIMVGHVLGAELADPDDVRFGRLLFERDAAAAARPGSRD
ncbi:MAG TPA: FAD-dependent oxidoreductase [Candidatus Micrarchaeaceae archaeon]|nr:FAD-dependent oxidoreductase [Candidatus Micrarchaeaceae archaeon]